MKKDKKGRFTSESEADDYQGYKFTITFSSLKNLIFWIFIIVLVWSNILQKLLEFFENILVQKEGLETSKKNGLFYLIIYL